MEFFTALVFYYKLQGEPMVAKIWFESRAQCEKALRVDEFIEAVYQDSLHVHVACDVSKVASNSIRPKARPEMFAQEGA